MPVEHGPHDPGRGDPDGDEWFAVAIEQGRTPGSVADAGLARDLQIVAMLRSAGEAYAPRPDEKARARQRLMAMLAQPDAVATAPPRRPLPPDADPDTGSDAPTTLMPTVTAPAAELPATELPAAELPAAELPAAELPETDEPAADLVPLGRAGRRAGRHTLPRSMSSRPEGHPRTGSRSIARRIGKRTVVLGAAVLVAIIGAVGGTVVASRDALPGDALYAVKRAAESAGLAMTFDRTAKARRQLDLAGIRINEVEQLVAADPAEVAADPHLVQSTIQDFDSATGDGARGLMDTDDAGGPVALGDLRAWAAEQSAKLSSLRSELPAGTVAGADGSLSLLDRLLSRTQSLRERSNCTQVTSGTVDDLGPLPASGTCSPRSAGPRTTTGGGHSTDSTDTAGTDTAGTGTAGTGTAGTDPSTPNPTGPDQGIVPGTDSAPTTSSPGSTPDTSSSSPTTAPSGGNISVPLRLPLLPPITLPPLLPGLPGITIG
jgi:hypothetical protein